VVEVWIKLKIHPFRWDLLKPITAGIVTVGCIAVLRAVVPIHSLLMDVVWIALLGCAYVLLIILQKLDEDDRIVLRAIRQRLIALPRSASPARDERAPAP
jgi:O-antigen/teichoic acid export membrane protein